MRPIALFLTASLLVLAPCVDGASVAIDAFCYTDLVGGGSITQTFSIRQNAPTMGGCSVGTPPDTFPGLEAEFADAKALVDYDVSSGEFLSMGRLALEVDYPIDDPSNTSDLHSRASVSLALSLIASSPGPSRPGLIELMAVNPITSEGTASALLEEQVGSIVRTLDSSGGIIGTFPFVLGEPFPVRVSIEAFALDSGFYAYGYQETFFRLNFRLTELDGMPVDIQLTAVPEPSTLLLVASVLPLLIVRRFRCHQARNAACTHEGRCPPSLVAVSRGPAHPPHRRVPLPVEPR
jgi:hypothetical protein